MSFGFKTPPSPFFSGTSFFATTPASTIRTFIVFSFGIARRDAFFRRHHQFRLARQIGQKIHELFDMALERNRGVDEPVIAEYFRCAEVAAAHVDRSFLPMRRAISRSAACACAAVSA